MSMRKRRRTTGALLLAAALAVPAASAAQASPELRKGKGHAAGHDKPRKGNPRNIIVLIGDGMGFNAVDQASLYQYGSSMRQVKGSPGAVDEVGGSASQVYQSFPVQLAMSTPAIDNTYDPVAAWSAFGSVTNKPTDSSAAATAMSAGVKTYNGAIAVDVDKQPVETIVERAQALGKATGVVSTVPFSHATPAGYVAHNENRNNYHAIATEMIDSGVDVILSAGHPAYDDSHRRLGKPSYKYINQVDFDRVSRGETKFEYLETKADFERLSTMPIARSHEAPKVFGLTQVGSTNQQGRTGADKEVEPFATPMNDVPSLDTMTKGALNVLSSDRDGFFLMVEGGAIDWAGHANQNTRSIEETIDFNRAVEATVQWVEENSSWDETLVVVTADHETGYLAGPGANPNWTPITGEQGKLPKVSWHSGDHTNQLVPFYAKGAGSWQFKERADRFDPVRGAYLDNTDLGQAQFDLFAPRRWWRW